jgi:hypothetical protein
MLQGSEWSVACKRLYFVLFNDKSCSMCLEQYYEYVLLDVEREHNFPVLSRLGSPQHLGFPILVVLDCLGRFIHLQATVELDKEPQTMSSSGPDTLKVLKFLMHWREGGPADKAAEPLVEEEEEVPESPS